MAKKLYNLIIYGVLNHCKCMFLKHHLYGIHKISIFFGTVYYSAAQPNSYIHNVTEIKISFTHNNILNLSHLNKQLHLSCYPPPLTS